MRFLIQNFCGMYLVQRHNLGVICLPHMYVITVVDGIVILTIPNVIVQITSWAGQNIVDIFRHYNVGEYIELWLFLL